MSRSPRRPRRLSSRNASVWVCPVFSHFLGQRSAERALPNVANHEQPYIVRLLTRFWLWRLWQIRCWPPVLLKESRSFAALPSFPGVHLQSSVGRVVGTPAVFGLCEAMKSTGRKYSKHFQQREASLPHWCLDGSVCFHPVRCWHVKRVLGGPRSAGGSCRCRARDADQGLPRASMSGASRCQSENDGAAPGQPLRFPVTLSQSTGDRTRSSPTRRRGG